LGGGEVDVSRVLRARCAIGRKTLEIGVAVAPHGFDAHNSVARQPGHADLGTDVTVKVLDPFLYG